MELLWVQPRREKEGWRERQSGGGGGQSEDGVKRTGREGEEGRRRKIKDKEAQRAPSGCLRVSERQKNATWNKVVRKLKTEHESI